MPRRSKDTGLGKAMRKIDRKLSISPRPQSEGMREGLVIAYGHPISPPYRIEYRGSVLVVNDVQVSPSLPMERARKAFTQQPGRQSNRERRLAEATAFDEMSKQAKEIYSKRLQSGTVNEAKAEVTRFIGNQKLFARAEWQTDAQLLVQLSNRKATDKQRVIFFSPTGPNPITSSDSPDKEEKTKRAHISELEEALRKGKCIFFSSGSPLVLPDPRKAVSELMKDSTLSDDERIDRLRDGVFEGNLAAALDVIANYKSENWAR